MLENISTKPNIEIKLNTHQAEVPVEANDVTKISQTLAQLAQEFSDNPSTKEERRKARADKLTKLTQEASQGTFSSPEELKIIFSQIKQDQRSFSSSMDKLDLSVLKNDAEIAKAFTAFMEKEKDNPEIKSILSSLTVASSWLPDNALYDKLFATIASVNEHYVAPYQDVAEVLSEIYSAYSAINTAVSEMISKGSVDEEGNKINVMVSGVGAAIDKMDALFYGPDSALAAKLKAIQFSPADIAKAKELVEGTGLLLVGGPPDNENYWLAISREPSDELKKAFHAIVSNYPANVYANITTYQLQSFQTAFNAIGEQLSSQMQTGAEKFKRTITQNDSFVKLLSAFLQANIEANRQFVN